MVVKVYVSGISGNKEVKKRQQRVLMILDSKTIKYEVIDITEPGRDDDKEFMQNNSKSNGGTVSDPNPRHPLPPQLFNDDEYCGDYDQFDMANEVDTLEQFLKVEVPPEDTPQDDNKENILNGDATGKKSKESSQERSASKEGTPAKEGTPTKEGKASREATPAKEGKASREATPAKEGKASREATPAKDKTPSKEVTPAPEEEPTPAKEESPARQQSVDKDAALPAKETEAISKESSPVVNENGTASLRASAEKGEGDAPVDSIKDVSEALITSEQQAAAE